MAHKLIQVNGHYYFFYVFEKVVYGLIIFLVLNLNWGPSNSCSMNFQILRSESIEFVVAPYEADAQLAYLSALEADKGGISAVITEDSDLVAYGCPTVRNSTEVYYGA